MKQLLILIFLIPGIAFSQLPCNNWLKAPSYLSSVSVGDLDVVGDKLTVEALITSTSSINPGLGLGKIVSKHTGPSDVNYSLMAYTCEITTTNGYINTPFPCAVLNDKMYHVAMVYDGTVLKFFRNGYLLSSISWSGNLINNDLLTTIACGPNNPGSLYQQLGYINEVRIWNVARTQTQIRNFMNTSLPNPNTQPGLLGYYVFDNLLNKQGNPAYNGTLNGSATINEINPICNLIIDSCNINTCNNIDSVRIKDSLLNCNSIDFKGLGYTNTNPIASWQWYFGDGGTANSQNASHTYISAGTFTVKLIITDINGCKDSISKNVTASFLTMDAGPADTICFNASTILQATSTGASQYTWTPAAYLNNPAILNPVANPPVTTTFYLTATNPQGCSIRDSVRVEVRSSAAFAINPSVGICKNNSIQLNASGGDLYSWTPSATLNNASVANPIASPAITTMYSVQITDTLCNNSTTLSTTVTVLSLPLVRAARSNDIDCSNFQSQLSASGAAQYSWSPASTLNNASAANPIATPAVTTQYVVTGTDGAGCVNTDSITVKVTAANPGLYLMPSAFTPNRDGLNDCYGIKYWGVITKLEFSIYNRWGERIFYTTKPGECWDGKYKGKPQDPNVFVYMIKATTNCGEVFRKGTFALIK